MASTTTNNNSVTQPSLNGQKSGSTSPLTNATKPTGSSSNQQQTPVGTFPQRTSGGASTVYFNS
jgi:hypothetical protein